MKRSILHRYSANHLTRASYVVICLRVGLIQNNENGGFLKTENILIKIYILTNCIFGRGSEVAMSCLQSFFVDCEITAHNMQNGIKKKEIAACDVSAENVWHVL